MGFADTARKAAAWACSLLFVLLLSSAIIAHSFSAKFFEPSAYFSSFESRGIYLQAREGLVSLFSSGLPPEARAVLLPSFQRAITADYAKGQVQQITSSALSYLSSKNSSVSLVLDLAPVKDGLSADPDAAARVVSDALPPTIDLLASSPAALSALAGLRGQLAGLSSAQAPAAALAVLLLVPIFLLQPDWQSGLRQCCRTAFSCGTSTAIGGLAMAFLSGPMLSAALSSATPDAAVASAVSGVLGDVMREVGLYSALLSIPLLLIGFVIPRLLPVQPAAVPQAQPAKARKA